MKVALIGAGNVATHLGVALVRVGISIVGVCSRHEASAEALSQRIGCPAVTTIRHLPPAELLLIAISDDAIESVAQEATRCFPDACLVHTAGSVPMSVLAQWQSRCGVMYPLQTFSKQREIDFSEVPLFVEGADVETQALLLTLAQRLSSRVVAMSSDQRRKLHLAAVFACNFTNHCYALAKEVLEDSGADFDVLLPLIDETARKVHDLSPDEAQTGPAARWDKGVLQKHLSWLADNPSLQALYETLSESIHRKVVKRT